MKSVIEALHSVASLLIIVLVAACSAQPSGEALLQERETLLRAACPLGSSPENAVATLNAQGARFVTLMSPGECQHYYANILQKPEACAGGSRIESQILITRSWLGIETLLLVTYLFAPDEQLVQAEYRPFYTWL